MSGPGRAPDARSTRVGLASLFLLIAVLLGAALLTATPRENEYEPPYGYDSAADNGLRALRLWLEGQGYPEYRRPGAGEFDPDGTGLIFGFDDLGGIGSGEVRDIAGWVERGGTLVLVQVRDQAFAAHLGAGPDPAGSFTSATLKQEQPLLPGQEQVILRSVSGEAIRASGPIGRRGVPLLLGQDGAVAALVQPHGQGVVWHIGLRNALTNGDLRNGPGRLILPALLRNVAEGAPFAILTWGQDDARPRSDGPGPIDGLNQWLLRTRPGWAVLLATAATLAYLGLQGRRLGPALTTPPALRRRDSVEYVLAMAGLMRRAGRPAAVGRHHKLRMKRRLARPWHVSAALPDAEFVVALAEAAGYTAERRGELLGLLARLEAVRDDRAAVEAVAAADRFVEQEG